MDDEGFLNRDSGEKCKLFLATRHFVLRALAAACGVTAAHIACLFDSDDVLLRRGAHAAGAADAGGAPAPTPMVRVRSSAGAPMDAGSAAVAPLDPARFPPDGVHVYMPLFATGVDQLTSHEACLVQTSAVRCPAPIFGWSAHVAVQVGDFAAECRRRRVALPRLVV